MISGSANAACASRLLSAQNALGSVVDLGQEGVFLHRPGARACRRNRRPARWSSCRTSASPRQRRSALWHRREASPPCRLWERLPRSWRRQRGRGLAARSSAPSWHPLVRSIRQSWPQMRHDLSGEARAGALCAGLFLWLAGGARRFVSSVGCGFLRGAAGGPGGAGTPADPSSCRSVRGAVTEPARGQRVRRPRRRAGAARPRAEGCVSADRLVR